MAQALANPDLISLAAGLVDYESLPVEETRDAVAELMRGAQSGQQTLQYGKTPGDPELREQVVARSAQQDGVRAEEISLSPDEVIVTTGSQQLLQLLADVLIDPGDIVLMGAPEYFVFLGTLSGVGAEILGIRMDDDGLIPEALEEALAELDRQGRLARVQMLYCGSYHQNPSGVSLCESRRPQIVDIIKRYSRDHRILILEDAAYRELGFDSHSPRTLRSFDEDGTTVALAQTFSKSFSPGLKTGFGALPADLIEPVLQQKGNHDFGSPNFNQRLMSQVIKTGAYDSHVDHLRHMYRAKRDVLLQAIEEHFAAMSDEIRWTHPSGGLYVWLTLPEHIDTRREGEFFAKCIEAGVLYVPGQFCFPEGFSPECNRLGGPTNTMRLTYGVQGSEGLAEGSRRLAKVVSDFV